MTGRIEKTVFISYRRTNVAWALAIYQNLTLHGFDVFFDFQSIDSGNFEKVILENIKTRAHFLVILTPSALERCKEPDDWLKREIETALEEKRNIIPLMLESFDFGSPLIKDVLVGKLASLSKLNGLRVYSEYFFEAMDRLRERYLNLTLSDIKLPELDAETKNISELQKTAAGEAPPVAKEQLSAQEWFERGYAFSENKELDEAIRCFSEAIKLNPNDIYSYINRGIANFEKYDYAKAIKDLNHSISIDPQFYDAYLWRGDLFSIMGKLDKALDDYTKAIQIDPHIPYAYFSRGKYHEKRGDLDGAIEDFTKATKYKSIKANAYLARGNARYFKGDLRGAIKDFSKVINIKPEEIYARVYLFRALKKAGKIKEAYEQEKLARDLIINEIEYNQACFEAILGNTDEAIRLLRLALEKDQYSRAWASQDPDFENISNDPRFKELIGE